MITKQKKPLSTCYIESDSLSFHHTLICCIMFVMPVMWCKSYISTDFIIRWHHEGYCIMFCWVQHVAFHHLASIKASVDTDNDIILRFIFLWITGRIIVLCCLVWPFCWIHVSHWIFSVLTTGLSSSDKCCFACFLCFKYINSIITPLVCFLLRFSYSWLTHQVTIMLTTSKNVPFPGRNHHANHRYWWPDTLIITRAPASEGWLAGGYDLEIEHFQKWLAWWLPGGQWLLCTVEL